VSVAGVAVAALIPVRSRLPEFARPGLIRQPIVSSVTYRQTLSAAK
jgi:hypothetical protein